MEQSGVDIENVVKQLDRLETQIRQLQSLVSAQWASIPSGVPTEHPYVTRVDTILGGEPILTGTRTPVRAVAEHWKFGDTPEEIAHKLPHLNLAQIFDALSYYDDHRAEIEHYIALNRVPIRG